MMGPHRSAHWIVSIAVLAIVFPSNPRASLPGDQRGTASQAVPAEREVRFELRLAEFKPGPGLTPMTLESGITIYVSAAPLISNRDIFGARVMRTESNEQFSIGLTFGSEAAARVAKATTAHVGKPIAIIIDGQVSSAPVVTGPISDRAMISGAFTQKEAEDLVKPFVAIARKNRDAGPLLCRVIGWC